MKRSAGPILSFLCCLFLPVLASAAETQNVHVENFPETQQVKGTVAVDGAVSHIRFDSRNNIVVPISRRTEMTELAFAGTVDAGAFTLVTISLQGEMKGGSFAAGSIGVLLIPDEEPILRAFREGRLIQFAIENACPLKPGDPIHFSAEQVQHRLAFPRYRIYLYNTTNKTAEANLYLALTN